MSNSIVNTTVSGNNVTIVAKIDPSDAIRSSWIRVTSKYDYGYGKGMGVGDYPYITEIIMLGTVTSYMATKSYKSGLYVAELNIMGVGPVDFSTFELTTAPPPITPPVSTDVNMTFGVTVGGAMNIYKNNVFLFPVRSVNVDYTFKIGDVLKLEAIPASGYVLYNFTENGRSLGSGTNNVFTWTVSNAGQGVTFIANFVGTPIIPPSGPTITNIHANVDNLADPYRVTILVMGTGTGTYQVTDNGMLITTRTLTAGSGNDMFDIIGVGIGTHNYCATPGIACYSLNVVGALPKNRWSCSNACTAPGVMGEFDSQEACKAACVIIPPEPPVAITLKIDKTNIVSGDTVVFNGIYKPNTEVNIVYTDTIGMKNSITSVMTNGYGEFFAVTSPVSTSKETFTITACELGSVLECAVGSPISNTVTLTVNPKGTVTPPTPGVLKWKYDTVKKVCYQPTDGSGTYDTAKACIDANPTACQGVMIGSTCYSDAEVLAGLGILGIGVYFATKGQRK